MENFDAVSGRAQAAPTSQHNGHGPQVLAESFTLSRFNHKQDATPKPQVLGWPELCALLAEHKTRSGKDGPLISPATFGGLRAKANAHAVSLLFLDFDHGAHLAQVIETCAGYDAAIYSTWSHHEEPPIPSGTALW